jgi:thioredoxin-related protein
MNECIMNKIKSGILFGFLAVLLFSGQAIYSQQFSFDDGLKAAKKEHKKVIVDIYTDWCGWCKKMDREAYSDADIQRIIKDNFIYVKLNAEGNEVHSYNGKSYTDGELAEYFQVTGYPTTVFLDSKGKVIEFDYDKTKMNNLPGYYETKDFKKVLEYIRDGKYKDTDLSTII